VSSISSLSFWATRDTSAAAAPAPGEEEREDDLDSKENLAELDEQQLCDLIDAACARISRRIDQPLKKQQQQQRPPRGSVFPMQDSYKSEGNGDGVELVSSVSINPLIGLRGPRDCNPSPTRETQMTRISL